MPAANPFDPTTDFGLSAAMGRGVLRQADQADEAARRQADGAAFDMRALGAAIGVSLVQADEPMGYGNSALASHAPTSQPWVAPNFVNPQGGPPATTPKTA